MRYQRVRWLHNLADEPVVLYSEIDEPGRERRKVDEFEDGRLDFAGPDGQTGSTRLSETKMPSLEEVARQDQFVPEEIDQTTFDDVWRRAVSTWDISGQG